jgi:hypothetical protein
MTSALAGHLVFVADVFGEFLFGARAEALSFCAVNRSEACADFILSVSDEPGEPLMQLAVSPPRGGKVQPDSFGLSRHRSVISSIAPSVVNCLLAMVQVCRWPRCASARSALALIEPSGNANSAAFARRSFVSGVIAVGSMAECLLGPRTID